MADPALQATLQARYQGDLSGACVVVAVIEGTTVRRARYCALPQSASLPDWNAAFEIGSITKTMTAVLVSDLINKGKWSLDDPIAMHLPKGTQVPRQGDRQILVRDLLTHSAGLPPSPSRMRSTNPEDPWADLTEQEVLDSLGDVTLSAPIGTTTAYSNFGMAVVSLAVSRAYGTNFETASRSALFEPLATTTDALKNLPGSYIVGGVEYKIWAEGDELWMSTPSQAPQVLQMDSLGDFHALGVIVTPEHLTATVNRISVMTSVGPAEGLRVGFKPQYPTENALWKDWVGEYQLAPGATLKVFEEDKSLFIQGPGAPPRKAEVRSHDPIQVPSLGFVIDFVRNAQGQVASLTVRQRGNVMEAPKLP